MAVRVSQPATGLAYLQACAPAWTKLDLTGIELKVLVLAAAEDGASNKRIQALTGMNPSTVTRVVDRLVDDGLIERIPDRHDRRLVHYRPTLAGRTLVLGLLPPP